MANVWLESTIVALLAGAVGFFTVLRGETFAAHALPNGAFAGAAAATVAGASPLGGIALASVAGAVAIAGLGRRAGRDVATALVTVVLLATGSLILTLGGGYAPEIYSLLFGQLAAVSDTAVEVTAAAGAACVVTLAVARRPLMLSAVVPDSMGMGPAAAATLSLTVLAVATAVAVPVTGALLIFVLLVAPAGAARELASSPGRALATGAGLGLGLVWVAVGVAYLTGLPVGFPVGAGGAVLYGAARLAAGYGRGSWRSSSSST